MRLDTKLCVIRNQEDGKRAVHAYNMAGRTMIEGAITCHKALKALPIRHVPIPSSTARVNPKVPVLLPYFLPYLFQCLHCTTQHNQIHLSIRKTRDSNELETLHRSYEETNNQSLTNM